MFQGSTYLNDFLLLSQEDGGNTGIIPQHDVESQPVKKPRGRPKGSKKTTVLTGGTVRGNSIFSYLFNGEVLPERQAVMFPLA